MVTQPEQDIAFWQDRIGKDEVLLWHGRPSANLHFGIETLATGIFALIVTGAFLGVGVVFESAGLASKWLLMLIGMAIGLLIMLVFPLIDMRARRHTRYALSDKKAYTDEPLRRSRVPADDTGWPLTKPDMVRLKGRSPHSVYFANRPDLTKHATAEARFDPGFDVGFRQISDAKDLFAMVQDVARKNAGQS